MNIKLQIWRQKNAHSKGKFKTYNVKNISKDMSFFEVLDMINNQVISTKKDPIAFDHDCR